MKETDRTGACRYCHQPHWAAFVLVFLTVFSPIIITHQLFNRVFCDQITEYQARCRFESAALCVWKYLTGRVPRLETNQLLRNPAKHNVFYGLHSPICQMSSEMTPQSMCVCVCVQPPFPHPADCNTGYICWAQVISGKNQYFMNFLKMPPWYF